MILKDYIGPDYINLKQTHLILSRVFNFFKKLPGSITLMPKLI